MKIDALKVHQWLKSWDKVRFDPKIQQSKPPEYYYLCSIKAGHLKALTGVYQRSTKGGKPRQKDPNVQRGHEEERSHMIREFVQYGFPWAEMSEARRKSLDAEDLLKPGWLPTAIIINILTPGTVRNGVKIPESDLVRIEEHGQIASFQLPKSFTGSDWEPEKVFPFEVIDGQHRLWAFDGYDPGDDFELPVVAFFGLDHGWQAYLFWSVNITPKRINRSLAFDLYPLLRRQSWLEKFAGHSIYRETRCQELVETLWSNPDSPWYQRINMLGEKQAQREYKGPTVSQAAWIRSLMASFVKQWEGTSTKIGGLFGAPPSANTPLLPWNRPMQAAVLIFAGNAFRKSLEKSHVKWATHLRAVDDGEFLEGGDPAFYGQYSLISTDQGIRGLLFVFNDLCFAKSQELHLQEWHWEGLNADLRNKNIPATDEVAITSAIKSFSKTDAAKFIESIADGLASYDWRVSSTPNLTNEERLRQAIFRGSSGYKELRLQLLQHLLSNKGKVSEAAGFVMKALGYK
ncbi:MAG: DGQHR domain-containing protein [Anaerolineales bacterium]|nr:DGQHR domain-containing protein [Anaerolineales bacterium]